MNPKPIEIILDAVKTYGANVIEYTPQLGQIRANLHFNGHLVIFNYTKRATYMAEWTPIEQVCRGLIVNVNRAELVALPFPKFFNLNERPETRLENLPSDLPEITEKLDGSIGICYHDGDKYAIATRGKFHSPQADWATKHLSQHYDLSGLPSDVTLIFEIIYPENRIIINYGARQELCLIGARRLDGYDFNYAELKEIATKFSLPLVPLVNMQTIEDAITSATTTTGIEGWVVRFANSLRVKIKTIDYIEIQKLVMRLTPNDIRDRLLESEVLWDKSIKDLPEELLAEALRITNMIKNRVSTEEARLNTIFAELEPLITGIEDKREMRKQFVQQVRQRYPNDSAFLLDLLDRKPIAVKLLQKLNFDK